MDGLDIIAMILQAAEGDEEATAKLDEAAVEALLGQVGATEKLLDQKIEPGSFYYGMLVAKRGIGIFADPSITDAVRSIAKTAREKYVDAQQI